ncbi:MAG: DUF4180 domain-containing protein [Bacteroidota bacterium]
MEIKIHEFGEIKAAELVSDSVLIANSETGLQLLVDLYYQGFEIIIIYSKNITEDFFELKTGLAGEILQKFSNYRMQLIIIGDFEQLKSKSLRDFIFESNQSNQINFVRSLEKALDRSKI